jgi:hypothetical protein
VISATAAEGHTTDEVVTAIDAVVAEVLGDKPPTDDDLDLARTEYRVGFYDRIATVAGKADAMAGYLTFTGEPDGFAADLARYDAADVPGVLKVAREVLARPRVVLHVLPEADRPAPPGADAPPEPTGPGEPAGVEVKP